MGTKRVVVVVAALTMVVVALAGVRPAGAAPVRTAPVKAATSRAAQPHVAPAAVGAVGAARYDLVGSDGSVYPFGGSALGSLAGVHLAAPIVGMAATADGGGYYLVASDGGVFAFGDARFQGSTGNIHLTQPVVGMAVDPVTGGYWLVAADGGIFSYNAPFLGSTGNLRLNKPVVGMTATADGRGYDLVASDGGLFSYGDAVFHGSTGNIALNKPVVGMTRDTATGGYWLVASDGGIFAFDAPFRGSTGNIALTRPVVGMAATTDAGGYWMVASDGGVFAFGDATFAGSTGGRALPAPIVGMAAIPTPAVTPPPPTPTPPTITTASLPAGTVGSAYPATTLAATGGTAPYTWAAAGLPAGLSLSLAGVLSGTPSASGAFTVTVAVKDSVGSTAAHTYTLTVAPSVTPPAQVSGVSASTTSTTVALSWIDSGGTTVSDVVVRRAAGSVPPASPTAGTAVGDITAPGHTITDTDLTPSTTYSYALFARGTNGVFGPAVTTAATTEATASPTCTVTWTGASDDHWETPGNWSPARVPTQTDRVCIGATGANLPVSLSTATTVQGFDDDGGLTLTSSGQLTTTDQDNPSTADGPLTLAGTLTLADGLNVVGTLTWDGGGTLTGYATTTIESNGNLVLPQQSGEQYHYLIGESLTVIGTATMSSATLAMADGTVLTDAGTITAPGTSFDGPYGTPLVANALLPTEDSPAEITVTGQLDAPGGSIADLDLEDAGSLQTGSQGDFAVGDQQGADCEAATLGIDAGGTVTGSPGIVSCGTINVTTPTTVGDLTLDGGTLDDLAGLTVTGNLLLGAGLSSAGNPLPVIVGPGATTVSASATATVNTGELIDANVVNQGSMTLTPGSILELFGPGEELVNQGTINGGGGSLQAMNGTTPLIVNEGTITSSYEETFIEGANLANDGTIDFAGGRIDIAGTLSLESGDSLEGVEENSFFVTGYLDVETPTSLESLTLEGGTAETDAPLTITGDLTMTGDGSTGLLDATLTGSAPVTIAAGAEAGVTSGFLYAPIIQQGTLGATALSLGPGGSITNDGTLNAGSITSFVDSYPAALQLLNSGTVNILSAGGTLQGLTVQNRGTINVAGPLAVGVRATNGCGVPTVLDQDGTITGSAQITATCGQIIDQTPTTITDLDLEYEGEVNTAGGTLTVTGSLTLGAGGTLVGQGTTDVTSGATVAAVGGGLDAGTVDDDGVTTVTPPGIPGNEPAAVALDLTSGATWVNAGSLTLAPSTSSAAIGGAAAADNVLPRFVNTGSVTVPAAGTLGFGPIVDLENQGMLTLNGALTVAGTAPTPGATARTAVLGLDQGGSVTGAGPLTVDNADLGVNVSSSLPNLNFNGGPGVLNLADRTVLDVGTVTELAGQVETDVRDPSGFGAVVTPGPLALSGVTLDVSTEATYAPAVGDALPVFQAGSITKPLGTLTANPFAGGWTWTPKVSGGDEDIDATPPG